MQTFLILSLEFAKLDPKIFKDGVISSLNPYKPILKLGI